jgi:hypothetical protein
VPPINTEGKKLVYLLIIFLILPHALEVAEWYGTLFPKDISILF